MAPRLAQAIDRFNQRDYFASQERFEQAWQESGEEDRRFLESLVKLSVAMHVLFNRGGGRGVVHLLQGCLVVLEDYRPSRLGVDVEALSDEVRVYLEDLKQNDVRGPRLFERWRVPKIKMA